MMRKGHFTEEEDAAIIQRFAEYSTRPEGTKGVWTALSEELHRPLSTIRIRYLGTLTKRLESNGK